MHGYVWGGLSACQQITVLQSCLFCAFFFVKIMSWPYDFFSFIFSLLFSFFFHFFSFFLHYFFYFIHIFLYHLSCTDPKHLSAQPRVCKMIEETKTSFSDNIFILGVFLVGLNLESTILKTKVRNKRWLGTPLETNMIMVW